MNTCPICVLPRPRYVRRLILHAPLPVHGQSCGSNGIAITVMITSQDSRPDKPWPASCLRAPRHIPPFPSVPSAAAKKCGEVAQDDRCARPAAAPQPPGRKAARMAVAGTSGVQQGLVLVVNPASVVFYVNRELITGQGESVYNHQRNLRHDPARISPDMSFGSSRFRWAAITDDSFVAFRSDANSGCIRPENARRAGWSGSTTGIDFRFF